MKKTVRKLTSLVLALLFTASLPLTALALDLDVSQGSIVIDSVNATQNDIAQAHNGSVNVTQSAPTENTVTVQDAVNVQVSIQATSDLNVTLDNVSINTGETGTDADSAAISIDRAAGATVTVELNGTNTLVSDEKHAGLEVSGSGQLVIQDASGKVNPDGSVGADGGSLTATGGTYGAGIGSQYNGENVQNITITGGTVTATGGYDAAGIGGGFGSSASNITISGGTVTSTGGYNGAGIGGGVNGNASDITISGGTVTANGNVAAAAIGGGSRGNASKITITDGTVNATGGYGGAGIGSGQYGEASNITITGGTVTATGGSQAAGIGAGGGNGISHGLGGAENITITGGTVNAFGGSSGAGIGSGYNNETDNIVITGGTVNAKGGQQGAGIGSGAYGEVGSIAISGGTVNATGAYWSAGIGGVITDDTSISFSGDAQVTATGGTDANDIGGHKGNPAVTPDISNLSADGWYQAGADGEKISGSSVTSAAAAAEQSVTPVCFTVDEAWQQSVQSGVLTVTSRTEAATLTLWGWGTDMLLNSGIHTLTFVTDQAETTLDLAQLASGCEGGDVYVLTHTGTQTTLTLNGEAV